MASAQKQRPKKEMPVSPGRPKGVPNRTTALLKEAILKAAEEGRRNPQETAITQEG